MPRRANENFKKSVGDMSDLELWTHYETCLKQHDWLYQYSDDHSYFTLGRLEGDYIFRISRILEQQDSDRAAVLWDKYRKG